MVIDKISAKAMETLLSITFGDKAKHYEVIAEKGLDYNRMGELEVRLDSNVKKAYSPFSTLVTRQALQNEVRNYKADTMNAVVDGVKQSGIMSIFKKLGRKQEELEIISDVSEKCITDELVKSQRILESREFENPAFLLLVKGIKNLENPEKIEGLTQRSIQEVGALQIGMAFNDMKVNSQKLFTFSAYDEKAFRRLLIDVTRGDFIKDCCEKATEQAQRIIELNLASKQDSQYDAFMSGDEIDYSNSFKHFDDIAKGQKINEIKQTARHQHENHKFKQG